MKFFEAVPGELFSPLASPNRALYADALDVLYTAYRENLKECFMKRSDYTDYDQLPLFLNAEMTAKLLGISLSSAYELMHEEGFPALRIGNRIVVPKEKFCRWVDRQTGGAR